MEREKKRGRDQASPLSFGGGTSTIPRRRGCCPSRRCHPNGRRTKRRLAAADLRAFNTYVSVDAPPAAYRCLCCCEDVAVYCEMLWKKLSGCISGREARIARGDLDESRNRVPGGY
jgi:hypothetical protein